LDNFFNFAVSEPVSPVESKKKSDDPYTEVLGEFSLENFLNLDLANPYEEVLETFCLESFFNFALNDEVIDKEAIKEVVCVPNFDTDFFREIRRQMLERLAEEDQMERDWIAEKNEQLECNSEEDALNISNDSWQFIDDDFEGTPVAGHIVQYEEAEACETPDNIVKVTQTEQDYEDEKRIFAYNQKVFMAKYDRMFKDNLVNLMNEGFLNFEENLQVLQRNCNKIEPSVKQLLELMD